MGLHPGEKWATTNVDINSYFIQHRYAGQEAEWVGMGVWSSISWDGRIVESLDCPLSDLTAATFRKNAFGITYSVNRQIHLFRFDDLFHSIREREYSSKHLSVRFLSREYWHSWIILLHSRLTYHP